MVNKNNLIFVYAPDRCGKSTLCKKLSGMFDDSPVIHFDKPDPSQKAWHSDYDRIFDYFNDPTLICDRGPIEAGYYQDIKLNDVKKYVNNLDVVFNVFTYFIEKDWTTEMYQRHLTELIRENPGASDWWLNWQLEVRREQHREYNEFMKLAFSLFDIEVRYV